MFLECKIWSRCRSAECSSNSKIPKISRHLSRIDWQNLVEVPNIGNIFATKGIHFSMRKLYTLFDLCVSCENALFSEKMHFVVISLICTQVFAEYCDFSGLSGRQVAGARVSRSFSSAISSLILQRTSLRRTTYKGRGVPPFWVAKKDAG